MKMKDGKSCFIVLLTLLAVVGGCTPKSAPLPPQSLAAQQVTAPTLVSRTPSAEEAAWGKVVEAAKKDGKVTAYSFSLSGDAGRAVASAFEAKYGIKLDVVTGVAATLLERIKIEHAAKKFIGDTYDTSLPALLAAKQLGLTETVGALPELRQRDVWYMYPAFDQEAHIIARGVVYATPYINTSQVRLPEEPSSYMDMLLPRWKGKLVIGAPATEPQLVWLYLMGKQEGFLGDDYFRNVAKQDPQVAATIRDADLKVVSGEAHIRLPGSNASLNSFIKEGAPLKPTIMKEGIIQNAGIPIALLKEAPHPEAARVFINWFLSQEGQTIYHRAVGSSPLRKDVPDFSPTAGRLDLSRAKLFTTTVDFQREAARLQGTKVVDKLMGLEK